MNIDSENTDIPESVRQERKIRKANEENPLRVEEVLEAYDKNEFNHLADRYEELGYEVLAKQYRNKNKNVHKRNIINVIIPYLSFIVLAAFIVIGARNYERDKASSLNETYVETQVETEPVIDEPEVSKWVTTTSLKVRTQPNTNCDVLEILAEGAEVNYMGDANEDWAVIDYKGQEAYVSKKYIREVESLEDEQQN